MHAPFLLQVSNKKAFFLVLVLFFRSYHLTLSLSLSLSIKVVHASAECLKVVLSTKAGSDALARAVHEAGGDESRWCSLLEPFKQQKKKTKVMLMHQSEYSANSK